MEAHFSVALRGYDRAQVDGLLDRIEKALHGGPPMDPDEIRKIRFDVVLRGYDRRAVDDMLHECVRELQAATPPDDARPRRAPVDAGWLITWIRGSRFGRAPLLRPGYDVRDVDAFLERVITGLRGTAPPITSRDVRECAFRAVRLGPRYDENEVDFFLAQLATAVQRP